MTREQETQILRRLLSRLKAIYARDEALEEPTLEDARRSLRELTTVRHEMGEMLRESWSRQLEKATRNIDASIEHMEKFVMDMEGPLDVRTH